MITAELKETKTKTYSGKPFLVSKKYYIYKEVLFDDFFSVCLISEFVLIIPWQSVNIIHTCFRQLIQIWHQGYQVHKTHAIKWHCCLTWFSARGPNSHTKHSMTKSAHKSCGRTRGQTHQPLRLAACYAYRASCRNAWTLFKWNNMKKLFHFCAISCFIRSLLYADL